MNLKANQKFKENQRSSKKSLCITGSSFYNQGTRCRTAQKHGEYPKISNKSLTRSASINYQRRKTVENIHADDRMAESSDVKRADDFRACRSAKDQSAPKGRQLKRSKSDVSIKSICKLSFFDGNGSKGEDPRGSPSALKRKESFTRRDIISDQHETSMDNLHRLYKFKLDVKVGVKSDHYNQWARNKRSTSVSLNTTYADQMSPPNTPKLQESKRRSLVFPRKESTTKPVFGILNFENFRTIFNDLPTGIPRVLTKKKLTCGSSRRSYVTEIKCGGDNNNKVKTNNILHVDGTRCKNCKDGGSPEIPPTLRISVGNVLEYSCGKYKSDKEIDKDFEKIKTVEKTVFPDNHSSTKEDVDDMKEIEAVFEANSLYLNVPQNSDIIYSDEDFDKVPIINGKTVDKIKEQEEKTKHAKVTTDGKNTEHSKVPLVPTKQDMVSKFEPETDNHLRFIIKNDMYRLSRNRMCSSATKELTRSVTNDQLRVSGCRTPREGKNIKVPLKLAMKEPVLAMQNVENNFAKMRIERHLNNLRMRTDSQLSARHTVRESLTPSQDRTRKSKISQEHCYKQTSISLNDQVDFDNRHKIGQVSVKIRCSAENTEKLRNTNKVGEILPFRNLAMQRKLWNLRNTNVI